MSNGFVHFSLVELCWEVMLKHVVGSIFVHVCRKVVPGGYNVVGINDSRVSLGIWSISVVGINDFCPWRVFVATQSSLKKVVPELLRPD